MNIREHARNYLPLHPKRFLAIIGSLIVLLTALTIVTNKNSADARPLHGIGFNDGSVMGDPLSWFGTYQLPIPESTGFCIDHKNTIAPDVLDTSWHPVPFTTNFGGQAVTAQQRHAIAWVVGTFMNTGSNPLDQQINNAAVELVEHDFAGAMYGPSWTDESQWSPINVDTLTTANTSGFGGHAADVIARAKIFKAYAWSRRDFVSSTDKSNAYNLTVTTDQPPAGGTGVITATLKDMQGRVMPGIKLGATITGGVLKEAVGQYTNSSGVIAWTFANNTGDHDVEITVSNYGQSALPLSEPLVYQSSRNPSPQRVVTAQDGIVLKKASFHTTGLRTISIEKSGDNEAYTSIAGAKFEVRDRATHQVVKDALTGKDAILTTNAEGGTSIATVAPGIYEVTETVPPPGYTLPDEPTQGPFDLRTAQSNTLVVKFSDEVMLGSITIDKTDSETGQQIGGAHFQVDYDADNNGTYEKKAIIKDAVTVDGEPLVLSEDDAGNPIKPGKYYLTETKAPPHYTGVVSGPITVLPGGNVVFRAKNVPAATVKFIKTPQGPYNPDFFTLAGAEFTVTEKDDPKNVIGKCTTVQVILDGKPAGVCGLEADVLEVGTDYCWAETKTPVGWETAEPGCFSAGEAADVVTILVPELGNSLPISIQKTDSKTGLPVGGAVFDLYREGTNKSIPSPTQPEDAPNYEGYTWVGQGTSDASGKINLGLQYPLFKYCAIERTAPAGYIPDKTPHCTNGPIPKGQPVTLAVQNVPFAHVLIQKQDAATKAPLANATFDLYRKLKIGETGSNPTSMPLNAIAIPGYVWVARGTSNASGKIDFGGFAPGSTYCVWENAAPAGYQLDGSQHCTATDLATTDATITIDNTALPVVLSTVVTQAPQVVEVKGEVLARTGGQWVRLTYAGLTLLMLGRAMVMIARRRRNGFII